MTDTKTQDTYDLLMEKTALASLYAGKVEKLEKVVEDIKNCLPQWRTNTHKILEDAGLWEGEKETKTIVPPCTCNKLE